VTHLANVNTTSLLSAIELGCHAMGNVFNADDNNIPFFFTSALNKVEFAFNDSFSEAHVPGRHLNALLSAEAMAGISISEEAVENHARAAFFSFGGALTLPLNRARIDGPLSRFLPHNLREGLHALYALIARRHSEQAYETMVRCIETVNALWHPETGWDAHRFAESGIQLVEWNYPGNSPFVTGIARAIGPLVKLSRATHYLPALDLALRVREIATRDYFTESGDYSVARFGGHVHSTTCTFSGLAQLAEATNDSSLMDRLQAFYLRGLTQISDQIGWSIENSHADSVADRGEANNTGDILETALILARHGYREGYADAERILRCHLLPSQVRDISFIKNPPNPNGEDRLHQVAERHLGAFGFPAPYGHHPQGADWVGFNLDIVGGAVASICEAYTQCTHFDASGHKVSMLFDCETDAIRVESPYGGKGLRVLCKKDAPLTVLMPTWVDLAVVRVEGAEGVVERASREVIVPHPLVQEWVTIHFPLTWREITLKHRTHEIRVRLVGESVAQMDNFGESLTFFEEYR